MMSKAVVILSLLILAGCAASLQSSQKMAGYNERVDKVAIYFADRRNFKTSGVAIVTGFFPSAIDRDVRQKLDVAMGHLTSAVDDALPGLVTSSGLDATFVKLVSDRATLPETGYGDILRAENIPSDRKVLLIVPTEGYLGCNGTCGGNLATTQARITLSTQLIDPQSGKVLWQAVVNVREVTSFDRIGKGNVIEYWKAILEQLKKDKLVA
jgi:hypothetical protein